MLVKEWNLFDPCIGQVVSPDPTYLADMRSIQDGHFPPNFSPFSRIERFCRSHVGDFQPGVLLNLADGGLLLTRGITDQAHAPSPGVLYCDNGQGYGLFSS